MLTAWKPRKATDTCEAAFNQCLLISREHVKANGGMIVKLIGYKGPTDKIHAKWKSLLHNPAATEYFRHYVIKTVDGQYIDWTARQFDPEADYPKVMTEEELMALWEKKRETPVGMEFWGPGLIRPLQ